MDDIPSQRSVDMVSNLATVFAATAIPKLSREECVQLYWMFKAMRDNRAAPHGVANLADIAGGIPGIADTDHESAQKLLIKEVSLYVGLINDSIVTKMNDLAHTISSLKAQKTMREVVVETTDKVRVWDQQRCTGRAFDILNEKP